MALNFDQNFSFNGIADEEYLKDRWQQEGNVLANGYNSRTSDGIFYTVPAGYVLYVSSVTVSVANTAQYLQLKDGVGGDYMVDISCAVASTNYQVTFPTPLKFLTNIYGNLSGTSNTKLSWNGWLEKL